MENTLFISLLIPFAFGFFSFKRLLTFLRYFQQEEYDGQRFLAWCARNFTVDRKLSLSLFAAFILLLIVPPFDEADIYQFTFSLLFLFFGLLENNPRSKGKKPLVLTKRATRILVLSLILSVLCAFFVSFYLPLEIKQTIGWLLLVQLIPMFLPIANFLLCPVEKGIQWRIRKKALRKLKKLSPTVIGITGSYGKTSTKHILGHILSTVSPTLITPKSFNTVMGICRSIFDGLTSKHEYFVVEMGAYGPGSIKRLSDFVSPTHGIITAIGIAHLERFKSPERILNAKYELADKVSEMAGILVVPADSTPKAFLKSRMKTHPETYPFGSKKHEFPHETYYTDVKETSSGLSFKIHCAGKAYAIETPLYGLHQCANITAAFSLAKHLEVPEKTIVASLKTLPQIEHRLEVSRGNNGSIIIDDAYNSNVDGFLSALSLLNTLGQKRKRRILVTPGMIELGEAHDREHKRLGQKAAECADIMLVIGSERIPTLTAGFNENSKKDQQVIPCSSFAEAKNWITQNGTANDVILFENDLPDLFEEKLKL